jgi:predicted metal-dependent phosphoesterase TrpH
VATGAAYFGDLHAHSALSDDATNPPDAFFGVARDVAGLDFVVLSDHDAFLTENEWEILKTTAASFHCRGVS